MHQVHADAMQELHTRHTCTRYTCQSKSYKRYRCKRGDTREHAQESTHKRADAHQAPATSTNKQAPATSTNTPYDTVLLALIACAHTL